MAPVLHTKQMGKKVLLLKREEPAQRATILQFRK